eukprot:TRINITY_DN24537_c0_g1_i1.p1 TRINITY_DN24537_c0_g1~~TRINITY_DN24537_c0_g1_i1.p1  ORF type:complete len:287 (+),score=73.48 TRINITY_DN24537_c0_g1_i1:80-862(+)
MPGAQRDPLPAGGARGPPAGDAPTGLSVGDSVVVINGAAELERLCRGTESGWVAPMAQCAGRGATVMAVHPGGAAALVRVEADPPRGGGAAPAPEAADWILPVAALRPPLNPTPRPTPAAVAALQAEADAELRGALSVAAAGAPDPWAAPPPQDALAGMDERGARRAALRAGLGDAEDDALNGRGAEGYVRWIEARRRHRHRRSLAAPGTHASAVAARAVAALQAAAVRRGMSRHWTRLRLWAALRAAAPQWHAGAGQRR